MKNLRFSVFIMALVSLICLMAPADMLAQQDDPPPCCHGPIDSDLDGIIIIDLDPEIPLDELTPIDENIDQLSFNGIVTTLPELADDGRQISGFPPKDERGNIQAIIKQS